MIAAFSAADQLRRRPAPVNTSIRRTGSGICLCSEIDMCRSPRVGFEHHPSARTPKGAAQTPLTVRSERQLMERIEFDLLFRWFVGIGVDDPAWDHSSFSANRDRLLAGEIAAKFL